MRTVRMSAPTSSIARARIAFEQEAQRKRQADAVRRTRYRKKNVFVALCFGTGVVVLVGTGVHQGWFTGVEPPAMSARDAAARKFVATRNGMVRTPIEGNTCRELAFNNEIGLFVAEGVAPCEPDRRAPTEAQKDAEERFHSIREKFVK